MEQQQKVNKKFHPQHKSFAHSQELLAASVGGDQQQQE